MTAFQDEQDGGRTGFQAGMRIGTQRSLRTSKRSSAAADQPLQVRDAGVRVGHRALAAGFLREDGVLLEDVPAVVALAAQVPDDRSDQAMTHHVVPGTTSTHGGSDLVSLSRLFRVRRDQGVDVGLEIGDPQPRCPFHVDQRQPPRGDESLDRPYRYPELFGGLCLGDQ